MTIYTRLWILGALFVLAACPSEGSNKLREDAALPPMTCMVDTECDTGVCNAMSKICVECRIPDKVDACVGNKPICDGNSCRGCETHSECPDSNTCLPTGACALESEVVYLREGGIGPNCTKMLGCGQLAIALGQVTPTRKYIRVTGEIDVEGAVIDGGKSVSLIGSDRVGMGPLTSILEGPGGNMTGQPTLRVSGDAKVEIYQMVLRNSREAAIEVQQGSLVMRKSQIGNADKEGVKIDNGASRVEIYETEIVSGGTDSMGGAFYAGIRLIDGELIVARSQIVGNLGGGVAIDSGRKFLITNSLFAENRGNGAISAPSPGGASRLEFNTIVDNQDAGNGLLDAGGVSCDQMGFVAANNIIFRNTSNGTSEFVQTAGRCAYGNSLVSSNAVAETRSLGFVKDTPPRDYHLTSASPALVKDVVSCTAAADFVDYDGEPRPQGGACELGADEIKQ